MTTVPTFPYDFTGITTGLIDLYTQDQINSNKELIEVLLKIENPTWENYIQPWMDLDEQNDFKNMIFNLSSFHTVEEIRNKCSDCETEYSKFNIEVSMNRDLFKIYKLYYDTNFKTETNAERIKFIEDGMLKYKSLGLNLPEEQYNKVKEIRMKLTELCNKYDLNLNNEKSSYLLTKEQLTGMSDQFLEKRKEKDSDLYKITIKYPDYYPIMEKCSNAETRKMLHIAFNNKCGDENIKIAEQVFPLRKEFANILGFEQFSDYALINKMAKKTDTVMNFLNSLTEKIIPLAKKDIAELSKLKGSDVMQYDCLFYENIYKEAKANLNDEELKKYFQLDIVVKGMFEIYQTLFGYKFNNITNEHKHKFWHEDISLYEVIDVDTNSFKGWFCLDMYPRVGKYGHAAVFPFNEDFAVMACNFGKGENIRFDDVVTLFHEFGHVMHHISGDAELACNNNMNCERDFVETPSQMLENWCFQTTPLRMMAPDIPEDVIEKLKEREKLCQGFTYAIQLKYGLFDMALHSNKQEYSREDIKKLHNDLSIKLYGVKQLDEMNIVTSFGHLFSGYAAGYYGYLYSKVFAMDMFYTKFLGNELNSEIGKIYRKEILSYGASRKSMESMVKFLGREPNDEAFIKSIL